MNSMHTATPATHDDLTAWLNDMDAEYQREEDARRVKEKQAYRTMRATGVPTWEQHVYNFKVGMYRKATGQ